MTLTVFVACPYTLFPLNDYKAVFSAIKKEYDVDFRFADEEITNQIIIDKIKKYIMESDISLCDITGWNPNVALELGMAIGLNRRYFILFNYKYEKGNEVPSDIRGIDRIQYDSYSELEAKIIILLKQEIGSSRGKSESAFQSIKERVIYTLGRRPGLNIAEITKELNEDKVLVQSTVRAMSSNEELKTRGRNRGTIYYTSDTDMRKYPGNLSCSVHGDILTCPTQAGCMFIRRRGRKAA